MFYITADMMQECNSKSFFWNDVSRQMFIRRFGEKGMEVCVEEIIEWLRRPHGYTVQFLNLVNKEDRKTLNSVDTSYDPHDLEIFAQTFIELYKPNKLRLVDRLVQEALR
jgi:hypothetical protein